MPAYRSDAEGEIRDAVVKRLREIRPKARIIHEINNGMSNRIDLIAVSPSEIIAAEIKSEKDTLDLLHGQVKGMAAVAHRVIVAHHNSHDVTAVDGIFSTVIWCYPEAQRYDTQRPWQWQWNEPRVAMSEALPTGSLAMVWKDELLTICARHRISATSRSTCQTMRRDILWHLSGAERTKAVCQALRERNCVEADPPVMEAA